ncbi:MAG: haloalkane dehalogenase [Pseudomonadota bacterium]|nr:haloalkane dehalogenase [Pseudomonadota bacterium]
MEQINCPPEHIDSKEKISNNYIEVYGSNIHYIEAGSGDPIVFLHGMPTSSFIWRKVMQKTAKYCHCYAPDLIGMGKSDKPEISYTIDDHINYIHTFIGKLNLKNITLVMHAWGSIIGFEYARLHPENVKGLAFYEAHIKTFKSEEDTALPVAEFVSMLKYHDDVYKKVIDDNFLLKNFLHAGMMHSLTNSELAAYTDPFKNKKDRLVLLQYINELPFGKKPNRVSDIIDSYSSFLQDSKIPKLLMYAIPGFTTSISAIGWAKQNMPNLTISELGDGLHFVQETNSSRFSEKLNEWYTDI